MLYIIATPIGNLADITYRAIEALQSCHYILCEDTRHSILLLKHYQIDISLKSFHKFNESFKEESIISDLHHGMRIGLISDAGTPGISDPGTQLIQACIKEQIAVTAIPGPCAAITALCSSGLDTHRFQFFGFLPKKQAELQKNLQEILMYQGTTICYESPNRLLETLEQLNNLAPERTIVVARELTKKFEEIRRGVAKELIEHWRTTPVKGEIVLMIAGDNYFDCHTWEELTPQEHVAHIQAEYAIPQHEAILIVAKLRNVSKRIIYNQIHS